MPCLTPLCLSFDIQDCYDPCIMMSGGLDENIILERKRYTLGL